MIAVSARLHYEMTAPTSFVFSFEAGRSDHQQIVRERLQIDPAMDPRHLDDDAGNRLLVLSCDAGPLEIDYEAVVALNPFVPPVEPDEETAFAELPADAYPYLRPSRYCESELLARFAWRTFGTGATGVERVHDICDWVHEHLDYVPGSTDTTTTALDVFHTAAGVCRDFSHLAITLCRAVGIPARYVSGYAVDLDPPDFHGFFEAFIGGRWYLFDATKMSIIDQLVRIATGRDAADVSFATYTGQAQLTLLEVSATSTDGEAPDTDNSTVSTA